MAKVNNFPKVRVDYFGGRGRADVLILLLEHKNIPYEKVTQTPESWSARVAAKDYVGEMGQLPIVHAQFQEMQQTSAILRSWGIRYDMYPSSDDWQACGLVDMILDSYTDVFNAFAKIFVDQKASDEEKASRAGEVCSGLLRKFLAILDEQLEKQIGGSKWLVTKNLTIADIALVSLTFNILNNASGPFSSLCAPVIQQYPNFGAYIKRLATEFAPILNQREASPF